MSPTPAPVETITTWMVLTELVIPAAGVIASTVIAALAIWLASRERGADKAQAQAERRTLFSTYVREFLNDRWSAFPSGVLDTSIRTSAKQAGGTAERIMLWLLEAKRNDPWGSAWVFRWHQQPGGSTLPPFESAELAPDFVSNVSARLDEYEVTGRFDFTPFQSAAPLRLPEPPSAPGT